jgi:hypothetical protein
MKRRDMSAAQRHDSWPAGAVTVQTIIRHVLSAECASLSAGRTCVPSHHAASVLQLPAACWRDQPATRWRPTHQLRAHTSTRSRAALHSVKLKSGLQSDSKDGINWLVICQVQACYLRAAHLQQHAIMRATIHMAPWYIMCTVPLAFQGCGTKFKVEVGHKDGTNVPSSNTTAAYQSAHLQRGSTNF